MYLRVHGEERKIRSVPLYTDVTAALEQWRDAREGISELTGDPLLFPRVGHGRRDGSFPDAGGAFGNDGRFHAIPIKTSFPS